MSDFNLDEIKVMSTVGLRSKGSSIFYSCTVLSVDRDRVVLNLPALHDQAIEINRKIELKLLEETGEYGKNLYGGTVSDIFIDSLELRISSKLAFKEKRKNIRVPCEIKVKYMEQKVAEEIWYTTFTINMSPGGTKMYSSRFHKEGDLLLFQFYIPDGYAGRSLLIRGKVLKIKKVVDIKIDSQSILKSQSYRKYIVNICFDGLSPRDSMDITRYIYANSKR